MKVTVRGIHRWLEELICGCHMSHMEVTGEGHERMSGGGAT